MSDLDNHLQQLIRSAADQISIPPSPVGQVMSRGQTRRRRQQALAVFVVVVFAAIGLGALSARGHGAHTTHVASNGATGASAALQWKVVDTAATLGYDSSLTPGGASALYAVSTAPGVSTNVNSTATLYRSVDGITWAPVAGPSDLSLAAVSAAGSKVYDVGTGTATAAVGVATSTDGSTWQESGLNLDMASILTKATSNGTENVDVAAGPGGALVAVTVNATLDLAKVLPAGAPAPSSWVATAQGVELLKGTCPAGPQTVSSKPGTNQARLVQGTTPQREPAGDPVLCYSPAGTDPGPGPYRNVVSAAALGPIAASYTWAQLGVSGDTERAVLDEPFGFLSTDGTTFHPVTLPGGPGAGEPGLVAGPTGFGLVGANQATGVDTETDGFWQSTDGTNWVQAPPLPDPVNVYEVQLGVLAGHYAVVDEGTAPHLETLVDDHWSVTDLDRVAGSPAGRESVDQAAFGPLGVSMVLMKNATGPGVNAMVLYSSDGLTWSSQSLTAIAGTPIGEPTVVSVTAAQVVVVAPKFDDGSHSLTLVGTPATSN